MDLQCFVIFYNHDKFVNDRLKNIFQIINPKNVIIIDDFSIDNTSDKIKEFISNNNVEPTFIQNSSNLGILKNWKACSKLCLTEFLWILEGDDLTDLNFLKRFEKISSKFKNFDIFSGVTYSIDDQNKITGKQSEKFFKNFHLDYLLENNLNHFKKLSLLLRVVNLFPNIGSFIFKKNVFCKAINKMDKRILNINYCYDWVLYYLLSKEKKIKFFLDLKSINYFRIHEHNFSEQKDNRVKLKEIKLMYEFIDNYSNYNNKNEISILREKYLKSIK